MAYDLRVGVFPVAFQAGQSQSWFGSALRAEYGVHRSLDVGVNGRVAWGPVTGQKHEQSYSFGVGLIWHVAQAFELEKLSGTVYPENPPVVSGGLGRGSDRELEMPVHQRVGDVPMVLDHPEGEAVMRRVYSLRLGFTYARVVTGKRSRAVVNTLPLLHAGFGWGTHWNVEPSVVGKAELGFRRYYIDALATLPSLTTYRVLYDEPNSAPGLFPVGLRIGMEGSFDAFYRAMPGFGFAYSLELGALPGRPSFDGYLFLGLGIALDAATR